MTLGYVPTGSFYEAKITIARLYADHILTQTPGCTIPS